MEHKTIYCPKCGRKVTNWNGKSTIDIRVKCNKCKKLVIYRVDTGKTEIKNIPPRTTSSGMRFY